MDEIWKPVVGYDGLYEVSDLGRVKSLKFGKEKVLKAYILKGYLRVGLYKNGINKYILVHRLVAFNFIYNSEKKMTVNHKNGIKSDNRIENLEWATQSENNKHAFATGLKKTTENNFFKMHSPSKGNFGKDHQCSKKISQFNKNNNFIKEWGSAVDVKIELGISRSDISKCCKGKLKTAGGYIWKYTL